MVKKRRRHAAAYKFGIAMETLEGSKTIGQLSSEHETHFNHIGPNPVYWRALLNCG